MKAKVILLAAVFMLFNAFGSVAATFKSGQDKTITEIVNDNLYIAGANIKIDAPIRGDLRIAASSISINDSIYEDLLGAASDILINANIGDDATLFGDNIHILANIQGDLILFASTVEINKDVSIDGDLIIFASHCTINGKVNGNIKIRAKEVIFNGAALNKVDIKADEITFNGNAYGSTKLSANEISLEAEAKFYSDVEYWQKEGEKDFEAYMVNQQAKYNPELQLSSGEANWKYFGIGLFAFWIFYTLSVLLLIFIVGYFMEAIFRKAAEEIKDHYIQNFGYGVLYFIGLPILALFSIIIIIGIPIGLVLLNIYILSILFAYIVSSVALAYTFNHRYNKDWSKWKIILLSILIFPFLKVISLIPFLGILVMIIIIAMVYGALIRPCIDWFNSTILNKQKM